MRCKICQVAGLAGIFVENVEFQGFFRGSAEEVFESLLTSQVATPPRLIIPKKLSISWTSLGPSNGTLGPESSKQQQHHEELC